MADGEKFVLEECKGKIEYAKDNMERVPYEFYIEKYQQADPVSISTRLGIAYNLAKQEFILKAGIEHFGRGIDNSVDLILMVVEPSYESLALTEKVSELGQSLYVKCLRKKAFLLQDLREGNFQTVILQLSGLPSFWKENNGAVALTNENS